MTQQEKNILICQYLGEKPRRMWRVWYNREKDFGATSLPSRDVALELISREKNSWIVLAYPDDYQFSEPEEYDDWNNNTNYFCNLEAIKKAAYELPNNGTRLEFIETLANIQTKYHPFFCSSEEWAEAFGQTLKLW